MTEAQEQIREQCKRLLSEHFDGFVLVTRADVDDKANEHDTCYDGGYASAIGLLQIGLRQMLNREPLEDSERPEYP